MDVGQRQWILELGSRIGGWAETLVGVEKDGCRPETVDSGVRE